MSIKPLHRAPGGRRVDTDPANHPSDLGPGVADPSAGDPTVVDSTAANRAAADSTVADRVEAGRAEALLGDTPLTDRASVVAREKEAFGGVKIGSAFFGWLTATGTAVLMTALIAAAGTAIGVASGAASSSSAQTPSAVGVRADIAVVVVMVVAYFCGGYVAGRMARFNGIQQGVAVWAWGVIVALVVAALAAVAGNRFDLLATLNGFPRLSTNQADLGHAALAAVLAVIAALVGAVFGGLAGMRFHRRVDRAGLGR